MRECWDASDALLRESIREKGRKGEGGEGVGERSRGRGQPFKVEKFPPGLPPPGLRTVLA